MAPTDPADPSSVAARVRDELADAVDAGALNLEEVRVADDGGRSPLVVLEDRDRRSAAIEVLPRSEPPFVAPDRSPSTPARIVARSTAEDAFVFNGTDEIVAAIDLRDAFPDRIRALGARVFAGDVNGQTDPEDQPALAGCEDPISSVLRAYHAAVAPRYERLLRGTSPASGRVREAIVDWPGRLGADTPDDVDEVAQAARFYPVLLAAEALLVVHDRPSSTPLSPDESNAAARRVGELAENSLDEAAVSPPISSTTPPFESMPDDETTDRLLRGLVETLLDGTPVSGASERLGRLYETAVPAAARKPAGEFFTDGRIARLIARWAVPDRDDRGESTSDLPVRILDPAAGSGRFLHAAGDRLAALDHPGELVGIDVNPVVLHLAAVGHVLSGSDPGLRTEHASFFSVEPTGGESQAAPSASVEDDVTGSTTLRPIDAIVGNPPFVRTADLPLESSHYRDHLTALDGHAGDPTGLSRRADLSAYFLTQGTRFLREGGRLGFVVPNKWLAAAYAEELRDFLYSRYKVHAVVGFGARAFDDALVDAVLVLAERCSDATVRARTPVRFLRVDEPVSPADLLDMITGPRDRPLADDGPTIVHGPHGRTVTRRQGRLRSDGPAKLTPYLNAPDPLLALVDHPALCPLGDLATVSRGVMTGANDVFFLDPESADERGIAARFLRPAQKSIRGCSRPLLESGQPDHRILDVHDYVTAVGGTDDPALTADNVKRALRRDGCDALADYLTEAEGADRHTGRSCQRRAVWFDLGTLPTPDIFLPKLLRERIFPIRNRADAVPSNAIDCLSARNGVDPDVLHGVLLSSVVGALMEVWGRDEAGMLQLMTYETETLPVPDIRAFDETANQAVREAAARLLDDPEDRRARVALDAAVADALDVDDLPTPEQVRDLRDRVRARRLHRGDDVRILVGDAD